MSQTVLFQTIPVAQLRVPGTNIEVDPNGGTGQPQFATLIMGQMTTTANAPAPGCLGVPNQPLLSAGGNDPNVQFGYGSMLALMTLRYIAQDPFGTVYCLPLLDDPQSTPATLTWSYGGSVITGPGTHCLRIAGILVPVALSTLTIATGVAGSVVAAINGNPNLPVTATQNVAAVTVTAKNAGLAGNDIDVRVNYLGVAGGESTPPGLVFTGIQNLYGTQLAGGTQNPNNAEGPALTNLGVKKFNILVQPYNDTASRTTFQNFMNGTAGRWSWSQMLYGHGIGFLRGSLSALNTFGQSQNDPAMSTAGGYDLPEPNWLIASDIAANCAISVRANPAQPLHDVPLGVMPPPTPEIFAYGADNTLLFDGISTLKWDQSGQGFIQQLITEYQKNSQNSPSTSFLYANTRFQLDYVCTDLLDFINETFIATRKILVSDATKVSVTNGGPVVTPSIVKSAVISRYYYLQSLAMVQNADQFAQQVVVAIVQPGILGISWPGDLSSQLNNVAISVAFTQT